MPAAIVRKPAVQYLDSRYMTPGIVGIRGIDQTKNRLSMDDFGCWYAENIEPDPSGWTNYKLGVVQRNSSTPTASKVQGIIGLGDYLYFVAGGNFYKMADTGGAPTMPSGGGGIFDSTAKVSMDVNQGRNGTTASKIYACDGVNSDPRRYSSATDVIATFSIGVGGAPAKVKTALTRTWWTFNKNTVDASRLIGSAEQDGDDYTFGSALSDAIDDYVWPGDGDYIVGLGTVQFKGQDAQRDAIIACKSKRSFMGAEIAVSGSSLGIAWNNNGVDIGAVSAEAIIQFGNDLWILTPSGIKGFNAVLDGSGGVANLSASPVQGVDALIRQSALNTNFSSSFAVHHSNKKKIRIFTPRNNTTGVNQNGFTYPEIPMDYAYCYGYGQLPQWEGNPRGEALYTRGGAGFAFSCACEHKGKLFLGDYFGNIYEMDCEDAGDDYIPAPTQTDQIIYSEFHTPFIKYVDPARIFESKRRVLEIVLHGRSSGEVLYNFDLTHVIKDTPLEKTLPTLTVLSGSTNLNTGTYGASLYGAALYGSRAGIPNRIRVKPPGWFNALGIRNWFPSKRLVSGTYRSNQIWISGVTASIEVTQ